MFLSEPSRTATRWWRRRRVWNSAQVFLRTETPPRLLTASRRKQRLMGRYCRYPQISPGLQLWCNQLFYCSENQQKPGEASVRATSAAARSQVCAAAEASVTEPCDDDSLNTNKCLVGFVSVSVIDLWPLVPRKLSVEDHLKEAKKLKHKADATVFIKPWVESAARWVHARSDRVSVFLSRIRWLKRYATWRRRCRSRRARRSCRRSRRRPNPPTPCSLRRWTWSGEKQLLLRD